MAEPKKRAQTTRLTNDGLAADLRKKYEKGASIRALAESTGRSYGYVHRVLVDSGVTIRGRSGNRTKNPDNEPREAAHRLLDEVPPERVQAVVNSLKKEAGKTVGAPRRFRTVGAFAADSDLAERSKQLARQERSGKSSKSA